MSWFWLAFANSILNSAQGALNKRLVSIGKLSKLTIVFWTALLGSTFLFIAAYFAGFPEIRPGFWSAAIITALINCATYPMTLRAYELAEFSAVYSMTLLTPVFLLVTSSVLLGESASWFGVFGVLLTVIGLWSVAGRKPVDAKQAAAAPGRINKGILIAVGIALLWSVSSNFDKLAARHSGPFFAPAVSTAIIAAVIGGFLVIRRGKNFFSDLRQFKAASIAPILPVGVVITLSNICFNFALLAGPTAYVVSVKRLGVLFGVVWGWLFFKEKNIRRKIAGALIAIAGVVVIVFS